jgi:hypothetical protein
MASARPAGTLTAVETLALWAAAYPDDKTAARLLRAYSQGVLTRARRRAEAKIRRWLAANGYAA